MSEKPTKPSAVTPPRQLAFAGGALMAGLLSISELIFAKHPPPEQYAHLGPYTFELFIVLVCILSLGAHTLIAQLLAALTRKGPRWLELAYWLLLACAFGALWQDTVMQGDGIRSHKHYDYFRIVGWIGGPLFVTGWAFVIALWSDRWVWVRRILAAVVIAAGTYVLQFVLTSYTAFHGFLALFIVANATWLAAPLLRHRVGQFASAVVLSSALFTFGFASQRVSAQRYVQSYTHLPAAVMKLPLSAPFQFDPEGVLDVDTTFSSSEVEGFQKELTTTEPSAGKRGDNILFIVLESTRADYWASASFAPRFQQWKSHGTYFPYAVAQYPATPLAYGAMFTAQPPSVLTQTPSWAKTRLFDKLLPSFDELILTRPRNNWFDHSAITDFIVPSDAEVMKHVHVRTATRNVTQRLSKLEPDETFFAWMHIYEPHQPWKLRREFADGKTGKKAAYQSEVRLTDDVLGDFMDWFYDQPFAEDTLVVMIADHGEGMGEKIDGKPYWGHHVHVRNVVSHVPAYFSGPGIPKERSVEQFAVQQLDVMPTMFDFLGVPFPAESYGQGESLYRLLDRPRERSLVTEAFSIRGKDFFELVAEVRDADPEKVRKKFRKIAEQSTYSPQVGLQHGESKLVRDLLISRSQIYDISVDPGEQNDLSQSRPELREELENHLTEWRRRQAWVIQQLEAEQ